MKIPQFLSMLALAVSLLATVSAQFSMADLEVVWEVVIAPKGGRAGANIGAVYNRTTGYPNFRKDTYVSGHDPDDHRYPPNNVSENDHQKLFGKEHIGGETFQNLMIWHEVFEPDEVRTIEVEYGIAVPLQKNSVTKRKEQGGFKGVWPQEANNMPEHFLRTLPNGKHFYFFDYYLTSGASWKGTIGEQTIILEMDDSWSRHTLFCQGGPEILKKREELQGGIRYMYYLRNTEPSANLLFALRRP